MPKTVFLLAFDVCMEAASISTSAPIKLNKCNSEPRQKFEWDIRGVVHPMSDINLCLTIAQGKPRSGGGGLPAQLVTNLSLGLCSDSLKSFQFWGVRRVNKSPNLMNDFVNFEKWFFEG